MGEDAVGQLEDHLARLRHAVEEHERERGMEVHVRSFFRPAPDAALGHLCAVEVGGADVAMAGGVDAGEPLEALGGDHGALDLLGAAEVEQHGFAENVEAVFVAVQLVGLDGGEAVGEHVLRVHGVQLATKRGLDFVRRGAHEGEAGPPLGEVAVVGEAAAEFAVRDLAIVDVPVDEALEVAEIFNLQEGPLRHAGAAPAAG